MRLTNKVALITGSGRGIGRATALRFAREGAQVAVCDVDAEPASRTAEEIQKAGGKAKSYTCDVTARSSVQKAVDSAARDFGRLDILVNNAGLTRDAMAHKMTEEQWDLCVDTSLKGTFLSFQAASKYMRVENHGGKIVNVSSISGLYGNVGQANYAAAKAGVIALTKVLAREMARFRVNVNAVAFGLVATRLTDEKEKGVVVRGEQVGIPKELRDKMVADIPLGFVATPDDAANAILFLASDEARYITGHVLVIAGGRYM